MAVKKISIFHSLAGFLGSWTVSTQHSPSVVFSIASYCPVCGEVWSRRVQEVDGVETRWTYCPAPCNIHEDGGQVLTGGDSGDFSNMNNVAMGVLLYELEREILLWIK